MWVCGGVRLCMRVCESAESLTFDLEATPIADLSNATLIQEGNASPHHHLKVSPPFLKTGSDYDEDFK